MINFIKLLSKLPLFVLYGISDFCHFILCYIFPYRKKVIDQNLKNSFPEKSENELKKIRNRFYLYFTDLFIEFVKGYSMSKEQILSRVKIIGDEEVQKRISNKQPIILVAGHQGNWEWAIHRLAFTSYTSDIIYQKLNNKKFNDFTLQLRTKFPGILMMEKRESILLTKDRKDVPRAVCLLSDQAPQKPESAYWTSFMNQDTAFFTGMERFARDYNYPVFYIELVKIKRGQYEMRFELLADLPLSNISNGEIIERFARRLERSVNEFPEQYLWSHRRWKHKKPEQLKLKWN